MTLPTLSGLLRRASLCVAALLLAAQATAQTAPDSSPLPRDRETGALMAALRAGQAGDWALAAETAQRAGPVAADVVAWRRLRAGAGTWEEARAFLQRRPDWPGLDLLRRAAERTIPPGAVPADVVAWFAPSPPQTADGALALIAAQAALGNAAAAEAEAVRAWTTLDFDEVQETRILSAHGAALRAHHAARLDALLWRREAAQAERMLPRVDDGRQRLAAARIALQRRADGVNALIAAVPAALADDAGLAHDRFHWRMSSELYDGAIELIRARSASAEALGRPEGWAQRRAWLARRALAAGEHRLAYELASNHRLSDGAQFADLEWLSGYIALRHLDRAEAALGHFRALRARSGSPISLGRAGYWEGRALEALGRQAEAQAAYAFGGQFQTAFYGLLAAERAGLPMDPALTGQETFPDWRGADFLRSDLFQAAMLLYRAGEWHEARRFFLHLGGQLQGPALGQLGDFLLDGLEEPNFALQIAKDAVTRGEMLMRAYFPVTDLARWDLPISPELALAIARRESEFDPRVISSADAQGLMQVLPSTGELTARRLGIDFDAGRLLTDPRYNARLGSAYIAGLIESFGPNLVLVSAGYNAGPGRPRRWMEEFGDPRSASVDPLDWIESIPFTETRNYVMRVMESVVVYRARLSGQTGPIRLSEELRGR